MTEFTSGMLIGSGIALGCMWMRIREYRKVLRDQMDFINEMSKRSGEEFQRTTKVFHTIEDVIDHLRTELTNPDTDGKVH